MSNLYLQIRFRFLGIAALLLFVFAFADLVLATHPGGISITLAGTSDFFVDSNGFCNSTDGPDGMWLPVVITNIDATETYNALQVTLTPPTNTVANDPIRFIGDLAPGASAEVFFFIDYRALRTLPACTNITDGWYSSSYSITVDSIVAGGMTAPAVFNDTFTSVKMISAAAGGALASDFLGPGAAVGQVFSEFVTYDFGNNPVGSDLYLQPTGNGSFNDVCYRLVGSEVLASSVTGVSVGATDQLFFTGTDTANGDTIQVEYRWHVLCDPGIESTTFPWAEITSGTQFKYDEGGFVPAAFPLPDPVDGQVTMTKSASPTVLPTGGVVTYTITFNNVYTQPIYVDRITDVLPAGESYIGVTAGSDVQDANSAASPTTGATGTLDWYGIPIPTANKTYIIPAGGSISLIYTASVPNVQGAYVNSATAVIGSTRIGPVTSSVFVGQPDLSIAKIDNVDPVIAGATVIYTLTVNNTGTAPANNVTVSDTFSGAAVTITGITPSQGSCAAGPAFPCNLGTIASGGSASISVTVTASAAGTVTNTATVSADEADPDTSDNSASETTTVTAGANLSITKADSTDPVNVGDSITYGITVTNAGPSSANNVIVTDSFSGAAVTITAITPSQGSCSAGPAFPCNLGTIASGGSAIISVTVTANAGGTVTNTTSTSADEPDPDTSDNSANETTTVNTVTSSNTSTGSGGPLITKQVDPPFALPGETVTWTITITNPTNVSIGGVTVEDTMPPQLQVLSTDVTSGVVNVSGNFISFASGVLAANQTAQLTISARVRQALNNVASPATGEQPMCLPGGQISVVNTACVAGSNVCASATVFCTPQILPATGESSVPDARLRLLGWVVALAITAAGFSIVRVSRIVFDKDYVQ